ncbi:MAG TPA: RNA 2',3'-cyclic phosphodiesterase [Ktedonobacterales bacterium]|jgi:2'-5' RNA ligase
MTRTFIAIELNEAARRQLARTVARLRGALPAAHWADPAGLHLTLAFLGELDDARLAEAMTAAASAAPTVAPFALALAGLGRFGPPAAPRVVWAGVAGDLAALARLHQALAAALAARAFTLDPRPFTPHLTLARLRTPPSPEATARLEAVLRASQHPAPARDPSAAVAISVDHLSVMRSELLHPAARYTCLRAVPLGRPAPA